MSRYNYPPPNAVRRRGASPQACARTALAVTNGARTAREVSAATGLGVDASHYALHALRDAGIVAFEDHKQGTLRPLVKRVR